MRPELPIIVMSAQNTFMTAIKASERGAYEYLPKPFDLKELVAIVGRALSQPRARPAATRGSRPCPPADGIPVKTDPHTHTEHKRYYTSERSKRLKSLVLTPKLAEL